MATSTPDPERFVSRGLLPENLPPIFTTRRLWQHFSKFGNQYAIFKDSVGEVASYNASKRGGQRRLFSVPHPAFIRDTALFFEKHWADLSILANSSVGSASKPVFSNIGNRYVRITPHSDLPKLRLRALSRYKFCLVADVARFFPSIYTHSIPWAVNGKSLAKTDQSFKSAAVFGNRLDFILRQSQLKQTIGIAIGPDTSKVVAELIMASVDAVFVSRSGNSKPTFLRHVDDYWIGGNTYEECEKHLQTLRLALRYHELDINDAKTKIISMKLVFGQDWPFELYREAIASLSATSTDTNGTLAVLGAIVERAIAANDDGIIRHVIRKIDEEQLWISNWEILEHFLAQCAVQFPALVRLCRACSCMEAKNTARL